MPLLKVDGLDVAFRVDARWNVAVDDLSFEMEPGQTLGIVGESGCGKSVSAMSLLRLVPEPPGRVSGHAWFNGVDLLAQSEDALRQVRGNAISIVFQEPSTSLNPVLTIGRQVGEALRVHTGLAGVAAARRSVELLAQVGIPAPEQRLREYPYQLSGGMRQRVMIATAIACGPKLLIADEPTTALDVTIQAQILDLLRDLQARLGTAIMLITHDLGIVAEMADRVMVMYAGMKVEEGAVRDVFKRPRHPYTAGLLRTMPRLGSSLVDGEMRMPEIPGQVPAAGESLGGCPFADRCPRATSMCRDQRPRLTASGSAHLVACHHPLDAPQ